MANHNLQIYQQLQSHVNSSWAQFGGGHGGRVQGRTQGGVLGLKTPP